MGVTMSWSSVLKNLLALCMFTHLSFSSVESYRCDNRKCFNSRCESNPPCESSKGCFYQVQDFEAPLASATSLKTKENGCSKDECTGLAFSATLGNQRRFTYDHQCCYTEQCNKGFKPVIPPPPQPNGVECPACCKEDGRCNPGRLQCTGEETKCIEVTGTALFEDLYYSVLHGMGCATETACGLKNMTIVGSVKIDTVCTDKNMTIVGSVKIDTVCTDGSPPLRSISSALTSLFLMKALL